MRRKRIHEFCKASNFTLSADIKHSRIGQYFDYWSFFCTIFLPPHILTFLHLMSSYFMVLFNIYFIPLFVFLKRLIQITNKCINKEVTQIPWRIYFFLQPVSFYINSYAYFFYTFLKCIYRSIGPQEYLLSCVCLVYDEPDSVVYCMIPKVWPICINSLSQ